MKKIQNLPKISLHDHLDGGLRPATIIELATAAGLPLPVSNPAALAAWFVDSCSTGDLATYLKTFELTLSVMQSADNLRRVAREYVHDLAADGAIYGEVRWAPEQHTRQGLSMQEAVDAVTDGIIDAEEEINEAGGLITVNQILCAMRQADNSLEVAELALANPETVVGFDLAGPESGFLPEDHSEALELLAQSYMPTTIHAGEEGEIDSVESAVHMRALRLGHGTRLALDLDLKEGEEGDLLVDMGDLATWVRDRGIVLECCPSSNLQTGSSPWGESIEDHPFDVFYQLDMRVTVNTDNRLMSNTTLTRELDLLANAFDYTMADLVKLQINAAMGAFLPLEDRMELVEYITSQAKY